MSHTPTELKYASSHEWARLEEDGTVTVGITDHAQAALGDVVFVELPEPGTVLAAGDDAGVVESVKAASDIYSPIAGEVLDLCVPLHQPGRARCKPTIWRIFDADILFAPCQTKRTTEDRVSGSTRRVDALPINAILPGSSEHGPLIRRSQRNCYFEHLGLILYTLLH